MIAADSRSMVLVLRAWLDGNEGDRNADRLAAFVIGKAISGHFGFFKLLLNLVDGKHHRTVENEGTIEASCELVLLDDGEHAEKQHAA